MILSQGQAEFKLAYELSPIIFTGGIAANVPGGMLPFISITESDSFSAGILSGGDVALDDFFASFKPLSGGSLVDNAIGQYPFANQAVAANAIIANPLRISLLMICPVKDEGGYQSKLSVMNSLQAAFAQHAILGGTYTVVTPSHFYTDCILLGMRDVTSGDSKQAQTLWQLDFTEPLLTQSQAQQAQNNLMSKISAGLPIVGEPSYSGLSPTVNQPPSLAGSSVVPAASGVPGASVAGLATAAQVAGFTSATFGQ